MPESHALTVEKAALILSHPPRWRILIALTGGEALPVKELARRARIKPVNASKHLIFLRETGVLVHAYGINYRLAPAYLPAPGATVLDLGPCLLKLPPPPPVA